MTKLEGFKVYAPEGGELELLGTIAEQIGDKGKAKFIKGNFLGTKLTEDGRVPRVAIIVSNAEGESMPIACSTAVSTQLRKLKTEGVSNDELLSLAIGMPLYANEKGHYFVGMEGSEPEEGKTIAQLKKVKKVAKIEALNEIAW